MTYTATPLRAKSLQTFGSLVNDQNRIGMTGYTGNTLQSQDAAASPSTSPMSNLTTAGVLLTVPANAVALSVVSTVTLQVGEDTTFAQGIVVPASTVYTVGCARMTQVALKPSSATNTTSFQFIIV